MKSGVEHKPTDTLREIVKQHARVGVTQEDIGKILDLDVKTLRKHYRKELDVSVIEANKAVGGALLKKALSGDTSAMIWWEKTRAGHSDKSEINHRSSDGTMSPKSALDASKLPTEVLAQIEAAFSHASFE